MRARRRCQGWYEEYEYYQRLSNTSILFWWSLVLLAYGLRGDNAINGLFGVYVVISSSGSSDKQDVFVSILLKVSTA